MTDHERDDQVPGGEPALDDEDPEGREERSDIADEPEPESEPEPEPTAGAIGRPSASVAVGRPGTGPSSAASPSDIAVHIDDRISAVFVLAAIAVFVGILLFGILVGTGGVLTPVATPTPSVSPGPTSSVGTSPGPSAPPSP